MLNRSGHNRTVDWYLLGVLLYELLVGIPPYYSNNRDQLFDNIKKGPLMLPKNNMSEDAKSLIKGVINNLIVYIKFIFSFKVVMQKPKHQIRSQK